MNQYLSVWSSLEVDPPVMSPRCQQDCGRSVCRRWTRRSRKPYRTYWTPPEPEVPAHVPALFQSPWRNVELLDLLHPLPLLPPAPICSVYGRRLHHPPTHPNPTQPYYCITPPIFGRLGEQVGHFWRWRTLATPPQRLFTLYPRKWERE